MVLMLALAMMLTGSQQADSGEQEVRRALRSMEQAWTSGALQQAGAEAETALALIAASACPVRPDAATAAFVRAVARAAADEPAGVTFWTAGRVADLAGAELPRRWRRLIEHEAATPGRSPSHDAEFAASPYFSAGAPSAPCGETVLSPRSMEGGSLSGGVMLGFFEWSLGPARAGSRIRPPGARPRLIYVYPAGAEARVRGAARAAEELARDRAQHFDILIFDPCVEFGSDEVCIPPE